MKKVVNTIHTTQLGSLRIGIKNSYILFLVNMPFGFNTTKHDPMSRIISPAKGDYITPIVYGLEKKDSLLTIVPGDLYYQIMATNFSYVSDYTKTLKYWDLQSDTSHEVLSGRDASLIQDVKITNAARYIAVRAEHESVVMFNEAHHCPANRVFVWSLLKRLKKLGFNYLALEALNHEDVKDLNARKYVLQKTGTYTAEPVFSSMVNYALRLDYELVAFEDQSKCRDNSLVCRELREVNQAKNLAKIFQRDAKAKVIVLSGYGHIVENDSFKTMARCFKEETNIDPLTVEMVELSERSNRIYEHPVYKFLTDKYKLKEYSVAILEDKPFVISEKRTKVDIQIISPRVRLLNKRPHYLREIPEKRVVALNKAIVPSTEDSYFLIQAFSMEYGDEREAVPTDQFLISSKELKEIKKIDLYLEKGFYRIKIKDKNNNSIYNEAIHIN